MKNLEKIPDSMDAPSSSLVSRADELSPGPGQPPDVLLLYWTLVRDQVLVPGYELQFARLETAIQKGSDRIILKSARMDNESAAVWMHRYHESKKRERR